MVRGINMAPSPFRRPTGQLFEIGDTVVVSGLESEAGRKLNGKVGVVSAWNEEKQRFDVRFGLEQEVALKPGNLMKPDVVEGDCVEVSGLESESGRSLNGQKGHVTSYFEESDSYQVCFEPERHLTLKVENVERPPLAAGDLVEVCGLESAGGKELNGKRGVTGKLLQDIGRWEVHFHDPEKVVSLKPDNLTRPPIGPSDVVLATGLESEAGQLFNGQTGMVVRFDESSGRFEVKFKLVRLGEGHLKKIDTALAAGDAAEIGGLAPESGGKTLNGKKGVVTKYIKETGMYQVKLGPNKSMNLQAKHLKKFGPSAGENVEVSGLTSAGGKELNGRRGCVVSYSEEADRFQVKFEDGKVVALKADNLSAWRAV